MVAPPDVTQSVPGEPFPQKQEWGRATFAILPEELGQGQAEILPWSTATCSKHLLHCFQDEVGVKQSALPPVLSMNISEDFSVAP